MARVATDGEFRWYEVARDKFVPAHTYIEAVRYVQNNEHITGWSLEHLMVLGLGPFDVVGYERRPTKGEV